MASKRRLRRKQCGHKRRHLTVENARLELRYIRQKFVHQGQLHIYRCAFCGHFHVGHQPGRNGIGSGWL